MGTSANAFLPFVHQSVIPAWFVVVFLLFAMVQLFAINSLDLYSSGVTLQALGVHVKRYQAVIIDSVICLGVTVYAIFDSSFSTYLKDFVDVVIVWIAPWVAIYLVDWGLRRWRYVPSRAPARGPGQPLLEHGVASTGPPSSPRSSAWSPPCRRWLRRSPFPIG